MVDHEFELAAPDVRSHKGIDEPVEVVAVVGGRSTGSRFEAVHGAQRLTPCVGRQAGLWICVCKWGGSGWSAC